MTDKILYKRTKEAFSSYISEKLFEEEFLAAGSLNYSKGWWISKVSEDVYYLFLVKEELKDLDKEVLAAVKGEFNGVFQVIYDGDSLEIRSIFEDETYLLQDFLSNYKHIELKESDNHSRDLNMKRKYFDYFKENDIEEDVVKEVEIENIFLKKYFYSTNVDFIVKNREGIFLLEVKYKYRTKSGNFGMNKMQYDVCSLFQKCGIKVFNIVLENAERLDILERIERKEFPWIYSRVKENLTALKTAPKETSYDENSEQSYYVLSGENYKPLYPKCNFLNLVCPKCGGKLRLKKGAYGEFLGCENYVRSHCRGTISIQ